MTTTGMVKRPGYILPLLRRITHRQECDLLQIQAKNLFEKLSAAEHDRDLLQDRMDELLTQLKSTMELLNEARIDIENTEHLYYEEMETAKIALQTLKSYKALVLPMVLTKLNDLIERNGSTAIYKFLDPFDREGWCLDRACHTLITGDIYTYFYDKDNRGHFDCMDGYQMCHWREVMEFGDCNYETQGMHEIVVGHKLDTRQAEYIEYQKELHKRAAVAIVKDHLDAIVHAHPELLTLLDVKSISSSVLSGAH